jgi:nanoRNase/pAp phosphatase (c-di-AMP/oligoRNAs hydrolase)
MSSGRSVTPKDAASAGAPNMVALADEPHARDGENAASRIQRLAAVLSGLGEKPLLIVLRGYPDPDSIGSAMALRHIAAQHGVASTLLHFDEISHEENRALVKKLEVDLTRYDDRFRLDAFAGYAVIDSQGWDLPVAPQSEAVAEALRLLIFIDHHKAAAPPPPAPFIDVREDAGATASILTEYLAHGAAPMDLNDVAHERLAIALMHGIRSDTDDFFAARPIDFRAAAFLAGFVDRDLLRLVSYQSISPRTMDVTQRALENKIIRDTFLIAGVGFVREEDRDAIGQAADYLVRREGIDTVIVYGIVNDRWIDGSLRTTSAKVDPDRLMKELFGVDEAGRPYGGGRADKGGFRIPIGTFALCSDRDLLWRISQRTIEDLLFGKLGLAREDS